MVTRLSNPSRLANPSSTASRPSRRLSVALPVGHAVWLCVMLSRTRSRLASTDAVKVMPACCGMLLRSHTLPHASLASSAKLPGYIFLLALIFFLIEQSYLRIYWSDFHDLFTKWKVFVWMLSIRSIFSNSSRDVAMATNLVAKMGQNYLPPCTYCSTIPKRNGISQPQYVR